MRGPLLVTAAELDHWATTAHAKAALPDLIRRLVKATVPNGQLLKVDFPAYAETHRPGYDGTTVTSQRTDYVPEGVAVWELGTERNCKAKAHDDYEKRVEEHRHRTEDNAGDDLSQATFIALTPRDWHVTGVTKTRQPRANTKGAKAAKSGVTSGTLSEGMVDWARQRSADGYFREVRAYDSSRLEQWMQEAQAVAIWFSTHQLSKPTPGVLDVGSYWLNVSHTFARPLPPEVFLTNRSGTADQFKEWLGGPAKQLLIKAPSAWEVAAVFSAWVHTLPESEQETIAARTVMVDNRSEWRVLSDSPPYRPLILVATGPLATEDPELFVAAERKGHHVLRFAEFRILPSAGAVPMERIRQHDLEQTLVKAKIDEFEAARLASASGGNLTILRRRFPHAGYTPPAWARDARLAPLVLLGAWGDQVVGDKEVVEQLTGQPYNVSRVAVAHWQAENDSPVRLILNAWEFLSLPDAWEMLRHLISPECIATFGRVTVSVLSEDEPGLSLPPDDRALASFKGMKRKYSHALRQGICEALAMATTREDEDNALARTGMISHASAIIREVFSDDCGWKRWASLGGLLPVLAEAAPVEFLRAVERDLRAPAPQLVELFRQELPPFTLGGGAYHSGLLWALETLAWSKEHMSQAASLLARLAELDPGGRWANRPQGSVSRIFFSWRPQTVAPIRERMMVLQNLCRRTPNVGWKIVLGLLPELHQAFSDSAKPTYRDWSAGWEGNISGADYHACIDTAIELAIDLASSKPERWTELIDHMGPLFFFSRADYMRLRDGLAEFGRSGVHSEIRDRVWEHLRRFVENHRNFQRAHWALPIGEIEQLSALCDQLQPEDLVTVSVHWFDDGGLIDGDDTLTYEQKMQRQADKRRQVVAAIWSSGGLPDILRLAKQVSSAGPVGWAVGEALGSTVEKEVVPGFLDCGDPSLEFFSCVYIRQRIYAEGFVWATFVPAADWTTQQLSVWALEMPYTAETWDWIEAKDPVAAQAYWNKIRPWGGANVGLDATARATKHLLGAGRAWVALDYVMGRQLSKHDVTAGIIYEVLEAIALDPGNDERGTMDAHHVHQAFELLHDSGDEDELRLARLEYAFLPFLGQFSPVTPKTLERKLATDPSFFIECLCTVFRARSEAKAADAEPSNGNPADEEANSAKARKAHVIFDLLRNWHTVPGSEEDGTISVDKLRGWVTSVRELAKNADRIAVCDITIGEHFAKSQEDKDGALPLIPIREIIEECLSEDLERGFYTGLFNRRSGFTKAIYEGGQQERDLAAHYDRYAQIAGPWPRTATVLRNMGKSYLRQAQREDEEAEARK